MKTARVLVYGPGAFAYIAMFKRAGFQGADSVENADIVCFTGGEDVSPRLYQENPIEGVYHNDERDLRDIAVYDKALIEGKFMVGICRGGQFLNVMNGGKLWQDVNNHTRSHMMEDVLTGRKIWVSSTHHQMFRPTSNAEIVAFAKEATMKNSEFIKYVAGTRVHEPGLIGVAPYHNTYNDIESCYYAETRSLCFQPHPEFAGVAECTTYFFEVLERYYNDSPKKEAA